MKNSSNTYDGLLVMASVVLLMVGISLIAAIEILLGNKPPQNAQNQPALLIPTAIAAAFTEAPTFTAHPPTETIASMGTLELPATWTPAPTLTEVILPTFTPWWGKTPLATADPLLFGDNYWEGIGDGYTLETYTRTGGRHLRFYEFPITVWIGGEAVNDLWIDAMTNAMNQVRPIIPMEWVISDKEATMQVYVFEYETFLEKNTCGQVEAIGCATIMDMGDFGGGDRFHRIIGTMWISTGTSDPYGVMLHELLHALGVMIHSPSEGDIMYPMEMGYERRHLSERDYNTLLLLYSNPSYAD